MRKKKEESLLSFTKRFYMGQLSPKELRENSGIRPYGDALIHNPKTLKKFYKRADNFERRQYAALTFIPRKITELRRKRRHL